MRRFFRLLDDLTIPHRWHIGEVRAPDGVEPLLGDGIACARDDLSADVTDHGQVLEFFLTSWAVPIAAAPLAKAVVDVAGPDVQMVPVRIETQTGFDVLNALRVVRCLDESRSEFMKWTEQDHRADLAGQYRMVTKLLLDTARIPDDARMFRVEGWLIALIVSEEVKVAMERVGCFGAKFQSV